MKKWKKAIVPVLASFCAVLMVTAVNASSPNDEYNMEVVAEGDQYVLYHKIESGFSDETHYYAIYNKETDNWDLPEEELPAPDEKNKEYSYLGDGVFAYCTRNVSSQYLFLSAEGETVFEFEPVVNFHRDGIRFIGGYAPIMGDLNGGYEVYIADVYGRIVYTGINTYYIVGQDENGIASVSSAQGKPISVFLYDSESLVEIDSEYGDRFVKDQSAVNIEEDKIVLTNLKGVDGKDYYAIFDLYGELAEGPELMQYYIDDYTNEVLAEIDDLEEADDPEAALKVLEEAKDRIGDNDELDRKEEELKATIILRDVLDLEADGNWKSAIEYIYENMEIAEGDAYIMTELEVCVQNYRETIRSEAEEAYNNGGYKDAVDVIDTALELLVDDEELLKMRESYMDTVPTSLTSITPHFEKGKLYASACKDSQGNIYDDCMYCYSEASGVFPLEGRFKRLTGTVAVAVPSHYDTAFNDGRTTYFRILGDGEVLWEDTSINENTLPMEVDIDITGVKELTVQSNSMQISLTGDFLTVLFGNPTLSN